MKKSGLTHSIGKDNVLPIEFLLMEKERKKERTKKKQKIACTIINKNNFKFENEERINFQTAVYDVEQMQKDNKDGSITLQCLILN